LAEHDEAARIALDQTPQVRLWGPIDEQLFGRMREQVDAADSEGPLVIELMTMGGDADIGRRMAMEVRLLRTRLDRRLVFLGATAVYSAGVTVMAAFPRQDRYLTADAVLLVHRRRMDKTLPLCGSLAVCEQMTREMMSQIRLGQALEREGFEALIKGSDVSRDEVEERAAANWYIPAREALQCGLIAGIVGD